MTTWLGNSPHCWPFVWGIHRWLVVNPHKRPPMQSHGVFFSPMLEQPIEQTVNLPVNWDSMMLKWSHCNASNVIWHNWTWTILVQAKGSYTHSEYIQIKMQYTHIKYNAYNPDFLTLRCQLISSLSGTILCMRRANEGRRYNVTSSLIGWAHAQKDPCIFSGLLHLHWAPVPVK